MKTSSIETVGIGVPAVIACVAILTGTVWADPPCWHRAAVEVSNANGQTPGGCCDMVFDPNGDPAIVYRDPNDALTLARLDRSDANDPDGVWRKAVVPEPYLATECALAFQPSGYPAMGYTIRTQGGTSTALRYAYQDPNGWHISERIGPWRTAGSSGYGPAAGRRHSLTFDDEGRPWLAWSENWSSPIAGTWGFVYAAVPIGDPNSDPNGEWSIGMVDWTGFFGWYHVSRVSLTADPNGLPAISYFNNADYGMHFLYGEYVPQTPNYPGEPPDPATGWQFEEIWELDPGDPNDPNDVHVPALVYDSSGRAIVSCILTERDGTSASLAAAVRQGAGVWEIDTIAPVGRLGGVPDARPAIRGDDNLGIAYQNRQSEPDWPLRYAWLDPNDPNDPSGVWQIRAVDWIGDKGEYLSLATDPNGLPVVAYVDATHGRLMYATTSDVPDTHLLVAELGGVFSSGSIETDPNADPNSGRYEYGTTVELTAVAGDGSSFKRWLFVDPNHPDDLNCVVTDSNNPIYLRMDIDQHVVAEFRCTTGVPLLPMFLVSLALAAAKLRRFLGPA